MEASPPKSARRVAGPATFLAFNAVYLLLVHGPGLFIPVRPEEFPRLDASATPGLPVPRLLLWAEVQCFGGFAPAYHAVNLLLLYGVMVCLFYFTRRALRGPWWLGSLVAVLTMANPLKADAVPSVTGVWVLWPMLLACGALLALAAHADAPRAWKLALAHALVLAGPAFDPAWRGLGLVLALYALVAVGGHGAQRWVGLSFLVYALLPPWQPLALGQLAATPHEVLGPMFLVFYPIGLLPETVARLEAYPWLAWLKIAAAAGLLALLLWKTRDRAMLFAVLAMLTFRLLQPAQAEDLVGMTDGGRFLLPVALGSLGLTALFQRIARHPKWARPVIMTTTALCLVFFALQWRGLVHAYRDAWAETAVRVEDTTL